MFKRISPAGIRQLLLLIIPLLYLVWSLQLNLIGGPFSLSRSDPEYPYLLNGLNCATLDFNNIGHTDHPGTPFQIITGFSFRITHLLIGQGPIVQDVLTRPETYLSIASLFLSVLTFLLLWWLGKIATRDHGRFAGALILQSSFMLSNVLIDMPLRYNPDRMLIIYNLILAGITIRYLFSEDFPAKKYAITSGILMGIGFATKFNFLPVLAIPFFLIPGFRNRILYGISIAVSFFIGVLPIVNKFQEFRRFITGVASHDGLYGQGTSQMINWKSFTHNFLDLLAYNPAYTIILGISSALIILYLINRSKFQTDSRLISMLKAFVVASVIGFVLVSKHFKVYYFAPVLSLSGLVLFILWKISGTWLKTDKIRTASSLALLGLLVLISAVPLPAQQKSRILRKKANLETSKFYQENVTGDDILFIEPTWEAGPMVENALVYGISYVAHRQEFYQVYRQYYPNVITWEGTGKNPGLFRTAQADPESILFSGRDIYVYSSPGRNAGILLDYLDTLAVRFGTRITRDTVFKNTGNEDKVIRARNSEGWHTLKDIKILAASSELSPGSPVTGELTISGVKAGDYIEMTILIENNDPDNNCRLIARSDRSDQDGVYFEDAGSLQDIGHGWQLLRLRGKINSTPANEQLNCQAYYPGTRKLTVKDLQVKHMGRR